MMPKNCNFCGLCCTLAVKVTEKEIEAIETLGHDRSNFTEKDEAGNTLLKRPNGWCYFYEEKGNVGKCKIYDKRPEPCKDFPGEALCNLRDNVIFKNMDNKHPNVKLLWKRAPKRDDPLPKKEPEFPLSQ